MDLLKIHGIKLSTIIGVFEWEQKQAQNIIVHLDMGISTTQEAFQNDQLEGTIDYAAVVEDLKEWLANHRCQLLEYLAETISKRLFELYPIHWVKVEVYKPGILPNVDKAAVCIERNRTA
ncbi:MAG: dihydroneopterin aldolase [Pseudomonadota bacterium]